MEINSKKEPLYAFPMIGQVVSKINPISGKPEVMSFVQSGMELRDYFASQALGLLTFNLTMAKGMNHDEVIDRAVRWLATKAYKVADAMLAEREKVSK